MLFFQFLSRGIHMHIPILTGVQNGRTSLRKNGHILLKTLFFRLSFRDEGDLYANFLFDVLTIYPKCYLSQFFSCSIRIHIPNLKRVQNGRRNLRKISRFAKK